MRKITLMVLLAVVSGGAVAEWVEVRRTENQTVYVVPATIRKAGDRVKLWGLTNYKTAIASPDKPYMSEMVQKEYDCKEEQARTLFSSAHSGNMGGGAAVHINAAPDTWGPVSPGSIDETLWKIACGAQ